MSTTGTLGQYADRVEASIDSDYYLGRLFWYAMPELRVPYKDFQAHLTAAGITSSPPHEPKDLDKFKSTCADVKRNRVPTNNSEVFENYKQVAFHDADTITRRIIRERVNNTGKRVGYTELFDVIFDRETSDLTFKGINGFRFRANTTPADIRDQIIDRYYMDRGCLNAYSIREWMRDLIMRLGATKVRPGGGVYFLREAHMKLIESLEILGEALGDYIVVDGSRVEFHSLPLLDDEKQREMVQRAFEAETVDAIDALLSEVTELTKAGKVITKDRYAAFLDQFQSLTERTREYEDLLEEKLASTTTRLDIFQRSLFGLRKNVKQDTP